MAGVTTLVAMLAVCAVAITAPSPVAGDAQPGRQQEMGGAMPVSDWGRSTLDETYVAHQVGPLDPTDRAQRDDPICDPVHGTGFAWEPELPQVAQVVTLTAEAMGTEPITFTWDLGDGTPAEGEVVTHTYSLSDTYTVILTATNPCGQETVSHELAVVEGCVPVSGTDFAWTPLIPEVGQVVTFTAEVTGTEPITFTWDLGDGTTAEGEVVTHTYAATGTYTVVLTASNPCGEDSTSAEVSIAENVIIHAFVPLIRKGCAPVSGTDFAWTPLIPKVGQVVTFTAEVTGTEPIALTWDLGDGTTAEGEVVTHTYGLSDTYTVILTASNPCGQETVSHELAVVEACVPVSGTDFAWTPLTPEVGHVVTFTADVTGTDPITFTWDLGDGTTAEGEVVTHTYSLSDTYTVILTATNPCGQETVSHQLSVVGDCVPVSGTDFAWTPLIPEVGQVVTFTAEVTGTEPITFTWDLGDGTTAEGEVVTHTYAATGTYTVVLTASNPCGEETVSHETAVAEACVPVSGTDFAWTPLIPEVGHVVTFTAEVSGTEPITFTWDLGDGTPAEGEVVTHTYSLSDTYTVILTATNPCGQETVSHELAVVGDCVPVSGTDFAWTPLTPEVGHVVTFTADVTGTEPITFTWDLGDGTTAEGEVVTHTYSLSDTYTVILTATNPCGQETVSHELAVVEGCVPVSGTDFAWTPLIPEVGQVVTFTAEVSGTEPITFTWDLGDGTSAEGEVVTHTYAATGTYTVVLTASNPCGEDSTSAEVTVEEAVAFRYYAPLLLRNYPPPPPPDCTELIENGGFEEEGAWFIGPTPRPARYTSAKSHSGDRSMLLGLLPGEADVFSYSSVRQAITIPVDIDHVTLTFWYWPVSDIDEGDHQEAIVLDEDDSVLEILLRTNANATGWIKASYDLTAYAGQTIKVYFNAYNDGPTHGSGVTGFYLDDVLVESCLSPGPPPEPPPPEPPPADCYPAVVGAASVGDAPHGVAVNSDAGEIYVADHEDDTLTVIDAISGEVLATVAVGNGPNSVAYNPANDRIYVANGLSDNVKVLRASDHAVIKTIVVGDQPNGVAVNKSTNRIYVANWGSDTVSVISGSSDSVIKTVSVGQGSEPAMIAVNEDTNKAYVTLHGAGQVAVIDGAHNVTSVEIPSWPYGVAVDALRKLVYVATIDTASIAVLDGDSDTLLGTTQIKHMPGEELVPLRMIGVNPAIGTSGHVFVTTAEDGGWTWNRFLLLPKGWPEYFARPHALALDRPQEGLAFDRASYQVWVTSLGDDRVSAILDGEPVCPVNFTGEYQLTTCVAAEDGSCAETLVR